MFTLCSLDAMIMRTGYPRASNARAGELRRRVDVEAMSEEGRESEGPGVEVE